MKIKITARQMNVRESLSELIERKLSKLDKFFGSDTVADVKCSCKHGSQIIEITILYNGTLFRSEEGSDTFQTALDRSLDALERQIRKNKTRLERRLRESAFADYIPDDDGEEGEFVIHKKTFEMKPMSAEEAIMQMNLLGHRFFIYLDSDEDKTCLVYKRDDGEYGQIIPS